MFLYFVVRGICRSGSQVSSVVCEYIGDVCYWSLTRLDRALMVVIIYLSSGRDFLNSYLLKVREHRENDVIPTLQRWMNNDMDSFTRFEAGCARAVSLVVSKVGLRERNSMTVESIQRALRDELAKMKRSDLQLGGWLEDELVFEVSDVSYWSELGTQFYFNPPFHVKAAMGVLPGFH